mgnify:CR=1 FL=1
MIFKRTIAKTELETVTITEFVSEFCKQFSYTHYISIDISKNGTVHLFLGGAIEKKQEVK